MTPEHNNNINEDIDKSLNYIGFDGNGKHKHHHHHRKNLTRAQKTLLIILFSIIGLFVAAIIAFLVMTAIGKNQMVINKDAEISAPKDTVDDLVSDNNGKTLTYKGKTYKLNENMTSILCMGIDKSGLESSKNYGGNGQADANFLLAIDTATGKTSIISINRDAMVDVNVYSQSGEFAGTKKQQLCLAFANGDGGVKSCENVMKSVSSLMYGIPVNSFMAIDFDAIGPLNDAVGGITVTPPDSFNYIGIQYTKGVPILLDTQTKALGFVRYRDINVLDSNLTRMQRQKQFLTEYSKAAIAKTKSDITFPITLYNLCKGRNINNLNISKITFLTSVIMGKKGNTNLEFLNVEGTLKKGETIAEFTPDTAKLFELILKVYYTEKP